MGIEIFLFALMVFGMVLVILAMVLYARKQREQAMSDEEFNEKEQKLMLLYFEVEDMITGLKEYVERAREVLGLEFDRLQAQAAAVSTSAERTARERTDDRVPAPVETEPPGPEPLLDPAPGPADKRTLYDLAADMARQNVDPAQIAEELHLSRSEITFIKKLAR